MCEFVMVLRVDGPGQASISNYLGLHPSELVNRLEKVPTLVNGRKYQP